MLLIPTPQEVENIQRKKFKDVLDVALVSIREALISDFSGSPLNVTFTIPIVFEDIPKVVRLIALDLDKSQWSVMLMSSLSIKEHNQSLYKLTVKVKPL